MGGSHRWQIGTAADRLRAPANSQGAKRSHARRIQSRPGFHTQLCTRGQAILVLSSAAIMLSIAMGLRQSLGLFQTPVIDSLGLQAADFAMAIAVQNIVWGLTQPFAGALVDRFGPRRVAIIGALLYTAGLAI